MYQTVSVLLQPYTVFQCLAIIMVLALWWRRSMSRRKLLAVAFPFAAACVLSMPVVGHLLAIRLESQYPRFDETSEVQAIVVLSGGVGPGWSDDELQLAGDSAVRLVYAARLYGQIGPRTIVVCGGAIDPATPRATLADAMKTALIRCGVAHKDILLEDRSRTTYENAQFAAELCRPREITKVALVTEATHMPRAVRCFQALGFDVIPAPCNFQAKTSDWRAEDFVPNAYGVFLAQNAMHEWIGILVYWVSGKI